MSGSTITTTVRLGSTSYSSPLTITSTGDVAPTALGMDGVYGRAFVGRSPW